MSSSPYYMNANENPVATLVSSVLTGDNYHSWCRGMTVALRSKNKFQFVDGTLPRPVATDPNFQAWDRCNTLVLSWLSRSIHPSIADSVMWMENAVDVWKDLRERYYQGDIFRISELQEDMYKLKQGESSITTYFTQLKALWQELDNFRPIPSCKCARRCSSCTLIPTIEKYREADRVILFLKGLHENYSAVRSQIMLMDPLPTVNKVFSLLIQQERQLNIQLEEGPRDSGSRGRGTKIGTRCGRNGYTNNRTCCSRNGYTNNHTCCSKNGYTNNYTCCNRNGYTNNRCLKKHGCYPPCLQDDGEETVPSFTHEQHKALLALLQEPHAAPVGQYNPTCDTCYFARLSFPDSTTVPVRNFDLLHMDIWVPFSHPSILGYRYFLTAVDDKSMYTGFSS
ncbi:hypothetical protein CR513_62840, partial [Mucuna pruriens]